MEFAEVHYDNNIAQWNANKYTVGRRRIMLSHWVGDAWIKFHEFHQDTIIKLFRQVGLSLAVDGSEGAELKIKDLPDIEIGDWEEDLELPGQMIIDDLYMSEPEYIFADEEVELEAVEQGAIDDLDTGKMEYFHRCAQMIKLAKVPFQVSFSFSHSGFNLV